MEARRLSKLDFFFFEVTLVVFAVAFGAAAFGFALTLGSAAGRALSLFPKQAGTASALLGAMQMSGASLLVFITQYLNLSTPELIGTHFLLLIPFSYLLFRYTKYA